MLFLLLMKSLAKPLGGPWDKSKPLATQSGGLKERERPVQEELKPAGEDAYLFNLDHFILMHQELQSRSAPQERVTLPSLPYDPTLPTNWYDHPERKAARAAGNDPAGTEDSDHHLVIDARLKGDMHHDSWLSVGCKCEAAWTAFGSAKVQHPPLILPHTMTVFGVCPSSQSIRDGVA